MKSLVLVLSVLFGLVLFAQSNRPIQEIPAEGGAIRITPVQHASLVLEGCGQVVAVDPAGNGDWTGIPKADLIVITDVHGDHMDPQVLPKLRKPDTVILAPAAVAKTVTAAKVLNNGETQTVGKWTVEAIPMYNLKRGPSPGKLFHDKGRGNGYVLSCGGKRVYISGDTENIPEMRNLKNIDVAFVCMNLPFTMPPDEAAEAVRAFHPKIVYPYHYRGSDLQVFKKALEGTGIDVRILDWYYKAG